MDFHQMMQRSSSVEGPRDVDRYKEHEMRRTYATGSRINANKNKSEGVMKIIEEVNFRKTRGLGDG